ncbi:hypothetical protein M3G03_11745 [Aestuariimicrobium sp. p3-SID1156]|uniref:hypothetical protein n=1 Tax=Aestuariimicrobium sp. p3-SID1156 TaxID=2916038 RepID=UPI00223A7715|nr:hypothetical protein [Aestuariimicrobium sp. p3-SID1156]MCT1460202.1 hypothetical protein [Aestuariimicrobium sp. p3-SID1156]
MSPNLRTAMTTLAVAALVGLAGCSEQETTTSPSTSAATTQSATVAPSSPASENSAIESSPAESTPAESTPAESTPAASGSSAAAPGAQTDQSLQKALEGVNLGTPLTAIPLSAMRGQDKSILPTTDPEACAFVGKGVAEPVIDGKPAAMATSADQTGGITLIEMGGEDAAKALLAERDKALDNPSCKAVKLKSNGVEMSSAITAEKTDGHGLEDARIMKSTAASPQTGEKQTRISLLGRKGSVIVQVAVPQGDEAAQEAAVKKILSNLG